ncbi:Rieske 2Fe-2S domain-containing protein [Sphingorhabdus sp.]|uniref:Rieske (2Fe-2S) protein n=1 Tax=Sphingorhabdus sp. TaxID=1902408 RepID=UPI0032B82494
MMIEVGELTREVGATAARAIEDELDWEHLPHVHAFAFERITLNKADRNGWDANVVLRDGQAMRMTVALDPDRMGYTNATFDTDGTENGRTVCRIAPGEGDCCTMHLRFFVPDRPGLDKPAVGKFYSDMWTRLIDEDEPKMIHRTRALKEGASLHKQRRQVTLADGSVCNVPLVCPHQGLPFDCEPDSVGVMTCPWHGYRFDPRTGECLSGQIKGWRQAG